MLSLVCRLAGCDTELRQCVIERHGVRFGEAGRMLDFPCPPQGTGAGLCRPWPRRELTRN